MPKLSERLYDLRLTAEELDAIYQNFHPELGNDAHVSAFGKLHSAFERAHDDHARAPKISKMWWNMCPDCKRPIDAGQQTVSERYTYDGATLVLTATGDNVRRVHSACFVLRGS